MFLAGFGGPRFGAPGRKEQSTCFEFPDETAQPCADGVCESGCTTDANCPAGWLCCEGVCDNAQVSALNCGACGTACESPFLCVSGGCEAQDCGVGHAECDGNTSD